MRPQTIAIHTGVSKDSAYNSVMTPIYQTSTFQFEDVGVHKGYDYTRTANPTRTA
ncbi:MAG TPA: PLP-dependent transferase, partial [Bacteroidota bacterium]|nr:PLP-dependent transferase [Bacteroidota bacterium]